MKNADTKQDVLFPSLRVPLHSILNCVLYALPHCMGASIVILQQHNTNIHPAQSLSLQKAWNSQGASIFATTERKLHFSLFFVVVNEKVVLLYISSDTDKRFTPYIVELVRDSFRVNWVCNPVYLAWMLEDDSIAMNSASPRRELQLR